jgi:hypothetical protein
MRDQNRAENFPGTGRGGEPAGEPLPLSSRDFVSREEVAKAFAGAPHVDYKRFREDVDAFVDPTPREWPDF